MRLEDALLHWLQIQIVWEARPADSSAYETVLFFEKILKEDHHVIEMKKDTDSDQYLLHYLQNGEKKTQYYPRDSAEKLLNDILSEPKYN